jgi:deoxyribonuclease-4
LTASGVSWTLPAAMLFGAHIPAGGGVWKALERGIQIGCDIVQLFVKNNLQWFGRPFTPAELAQYANQLARGKLARVFGHTGYLINLAAPSSPKRDKSLRSLIQEIQLAADLGLPFLVMHPGAHLGQGKESGLRQLVAGLDEVFAATRHWPVRIALENTAGQGTYLGGQIAHLAEVYQRVKRPRRLGLCLDTAHLFAAGYDIRTPKGWDDLIAEVDSLLGLKEVLAAHLNDSKGELGSRLDRHAHIGEGKLGRAAFSHIVNDPRFAGLPGCLETPKSPDLHEDAANLAVLRSLARLPLAS